MAYLKLEDDFFEKTRIKRLKKMAAGDTYIVIYLELRLLTLQSDGILYIKNTEEDFITELAFKLDQNKETIRIALYYLQKYRLIAVLKENEVTILS